MWASRVREQERGLRAKAQAAEQRATQAERRLAELVRAARDFGYADARFREILDKNGAKS